MRYNTTSRPKGCRATDPKSPPNRESNIHRLITESFLSRVVYPVNQKGFQTLKRSECWKLFSTTILENLTCRRLECFNLLHKYIFSFREHVYQEIWSKTIELYFNRGYEPCIIQNIGCRYARHVNKFLSLFLQNIHHYFNLRPLHACLC